uniref:Uncharacterized protein n=1 Tax=Lepeophtheirus salmonis TaxID=72036 RepID=A0A0K2UTE8_LEPSM
MSEDEENILERFLKVKKLNDLRVPSYDSDGIPSISSVDIPDDSSVSSGSQKHPYAQSSTENPPDMETVSEIDPGDYEKAKKLFEELKQISSQTGIGSVDNLMESLHSSQENLSSLIPPDKMSELNKFEMTLKDMIEEARMIADEADKNDRNKSASVQSIAETVIESYLDVPIISITPEDSLRQLPPLYPAPKKSPEPPVRRSRPIAPSTTKRITDSSLPRVSQYDEIIMSRRNSLNENSILTSSRGNSLPPPLDDGYTRSSTTPLLLTSATMPKKSSSPSPAQQRPLTMSNNKLHKKSTEKRDGQTLKMESMQRIHVSIDPFHGNEEEEEEMKLKMESQNQGFPAWLIITSTYSLVLICILLISNIMPDGKLFIHFTAFWSMLIYFYLDDNGHDPVLDTLLGGFVLTKERIN